MFKTHPFLEGNKICRRPEIFIVVSVKWLKSPEREASLSTTPPSARAIFVIERDRRGFNRRTTREHQASASAPVPM